MHQFTTLIQSSQVRAYSTMMEEVQVPMDSKYLDDSNEPRCEINDQEEDNCIFPDRLKPP